MAQRYEATHAHTTHNRYSHKSTSTKFFIVHFLFFDFFTNVVADCGALDWVD